jgi:ABC-type phosphate/phosphonate transport system substrate-binding protein
MSDFIAALPMYDRPECRDETDASWARLRAALRAAGIDAPQELTRGDGDLHALWRHPQLLFAQTCWGPMEQGLAAFVHVVGQPDYSAYEGGARELYSSAIVMRRGGGVPAPADGAALLPLDLLRGRRLAYNGLDSMSGILALGRDLEAIGEGLGIFTRKIETGSHRASAMAVAEGRADVCALDCRSWALVRRYDAFAEDLVVVGWTARRKGLPFICSKKMPDEVVRALRAAIPGLKF